jgi:hypothetical protein
MLQFGSCCINAALEFSAPVKGEGGVRRGLGTLEGKACRVGTTLTRELVVFKIKMSQIDTISKRNWYRSCKKKNDL